MLAGCASGNTLQVIGLVEGHAGGVSGDEPNAVAVARDVLAARGSAADAAVAWFFTAAATYPVSATLGAGGVCVYYDVQTNSAEVIDFPLVSPAQPEPGARFRNGVPGAVRGFFALHARYGRLQWAKILSPAEQIARLGHPVSRALARRLALASGLPGGGAEIARAFTRSDGSPLREGDVLLQLDLAAVLTDIRTRGPGGFYSGDLARKLADAVTEAGGSLSVEDLRAYRPVWRETLQIRSRGIRIHTAPPPASDGLSLLQMWAMLNLDDLYLDADADERGHLLTEVSMRAFADGARYSAINGDASAFANFLDDDRIEGLMANYAPDAHVSVDASSRKPADNPVNPVATSFVAVDAIGSAVACRVSLNGLFGVKRVAPGTGIVIGAAPNPDADTATAPVIIVDHNLRNFLFAATASGGAAGSSALMETMARVRIAEDPLPEAIAAPRFFHAGLPDVVVFEPSVAAERLSALRRRGHSLTQGPALGRVNAVACSDGFRGNPKTCLYATDPRGHGLATAVQF